MHPTTTTTYAHHPDAVREAAAAGIRAIEAIQATAYVAAVAANAAIATIANTAATTVGAIADAAVPHMTGLTLGPAPTMPAVAADVDLWRGASLTAGPGADVVQVGVPGAELVPVVGVR